MMNARMSWLFELHKTQPIAHAVGVLAFVCVVGMALGSLKFRGIGLGTAGVLFAGHSRRALRRGGGSSHARFREGVRADPVCLHHRSAARPRLLRGAAAAGREDERARRGDRDFRRRERAAHRLAGGLRSGGGARHFLRRLDEHAFARRRHADARHAAGHRARSAHAARARLRRHVSHGHRRHHRHAAAAQTDLPHRSRARGRGLRREEPPPGRAARTPHARRHESEPRRRAPRRDPRPARSAASPSPASATARKRTPPPTRP